MQTEQLIYADPRFPVSVQSSPGVLRRCRAIGKTTSTKKTKLQSLSWHRRKADFYSRGPRFAWRDAAEAHTARMRTEQQSTALPQWANPTQSVLIGHFRFGKVTWDAKSFGKIQKLPFRNFFTVRVEDRAAPLGWTSGDGWLRTKSICTTLIYPLVFEFNESIEPIRSFALSIIHGWND